MNVLVLVNSAPNYKFFYKNLANSLERKGCRIFYAVDSKRSTILEPEEEIDKSKKTFFFDSYLKENYRREDFVSAYQVTWGQFFFSDFDRFLTHGFNLGKNKEYWKKVKYCLDSFFKEIIVNEKIDFVLYENISNSFAYSAYKISKLYGAKYIGLMASRLPGRYEIQTSIIDDEVKKIDSLVSEIETEEESEWFEGYQNKILDSSPDYMSYNNLGKVSLRKLLRKDKVIFAYRLIKCWFYTDHYYDYQFGNPLLALFKGVRVNIKRKINFLMEKRFFLADNEVESYSSREDFFVYPIHFHPESSTSVLAPNYTNEYNNILNIANNLPFGNMLYVKEHKSAIGVQSSSVYKKISSIPNVRFINPGFNLKRLMKKSKGLITVNSTAGFEAAVLNEPVYLLGRVFYEEFPNVVKLNDFSDIKKIPECTREFECRKHVIAYYRYTYNNTLRIDQADKLNKEFYDDIASQVLEAVCH